MTLYNAFCKPFISNALRCGPLVTMGSQLYLPPTHEQYLPLLPSHKASPPFAWYSLCLPTKGWPGWVDLDGWLHTEINIPHRELNLDMVTTSVLNGPDVKNHSWSRPTRYCYARPAPSLQLLQKLCRRIF